MADTLKEIERKLRALNRRKVETVEKVDLLNQMAEQFTSGDDSERMMELSLEAYEPAISFSLSPLEYFRQNSNRFWEGIALLNLGYTYQLIGDYERSLQHHQALAEIAYNHGEEWLAGRALNGTCLFVIF
ncbi:MAG: hypothetical protein ACE5G1_06510 [bacterium]